MLAAKDAESQEPEAESEQVPTTPAIVPSGSIASVRNIASMKTKPKANKGKGNGKGEAKRKVKGNGKGKGKGKAKPVVKPKKHVGGLLRTGKFWSTKNDSTENPRGAPDDDLVFQERNTKPRYWKGMIVYTDKIRKKFRLQEGRGRRDEVPFSFKTDSKATAWAACVKYIKASGR
jgi:hypothetical protein